MIASGATSPRLPQPNPLGAGPDRAKKMRRFATCLLIAMAALFLMARHLSGAGPVWGWLRAFAEAAMVGGLADWFAVTALFRRPLGLPIPHTAIIPANKDRIADTMAGFLRSNFLIPQVVARRLKAVDFAGAAGALLANPRADAEARIRRGTASLMADVFEALDADQRLGRLARGALRRQLDRLELAPLLGQMLRGAVAEGRHLPLIEAGLRLAGEVLEDNEPLIRSMIHTRANALLRLTGLDERLANAILDGFYRLLAECIVDPAHPLRGKLLEAIDRLATALCDDPAMQARVARFKHEMLGNPAMARWMDALWLRARTSLLSAARAPDRALSGRLGGNLASFGKELQQDARLHALVNRLARRVLAGTASRYGGGIVKLVSETVKRWDGRTVTARIESAVGRDLQFIRINGTLVGGLMGIFLHAIDLAL